MRHPDFVRHIGSLLLAAVFGPAIFLLTGTGLSAFETARTVSFIEDPLSPAAALGALLLAGLLYGILAMVRLSPVGPGLTGIAFLGLSGWAMVAPATYESVFSKLDVHMGGAVGQWGIGFLLGLPLIATLTSPRRWRKNPYPAPVHYPAQQQQYPQYQQPQHQQPRYQQQAQYEYRPDHTLPDIAPPSLRYPAGMPIPPQKPTKDSAAPTQIIHTPAPPRPAPQATPPQAAPTAQAPQAQALPSFAPPQPPATAQQSTPPATQPSAPPAAPPPLAPAAAPPPAATPPAATPPVMTPPPAAAPLAAAPPSAATPHVVTPPPAAAPPSTAQAPAQQAETQAAQSAVPALPKRTPATAAPEAQPQPVTLLSAPTEKIDHPGSPPPPKPPIKIDDEATVKIDDPRQSL